MNTPYAGSYLAGIECDGARYHSSATARDRDKIRQAVLEGLGWTILRVWSTEWFRDSSNVTGRIHLELARLLEEDRESRAAVEDEADKQSNEAESSEESGDKAEIVQPAPSEPAQDNEPADEEVAVTNKETQLPILGLDGDLLAASSTESETGGADRGSPIAAAPSSRIEPVVSRGSTLTGEAASVRQEDVIPDPDRFFNSDYAPILARLIHRIVDREGPLTLHGLARKIAQEHGWQRTGKRIRAQVQKNLRSVERHLEFRTFLSGRPEAILAELRSAGLMVERFERYHEQKSLQ